VVCKVNIPLTEKEMEIFGRHFTPIQFIVAIVLSLYVSRMVWLYTSSILAISRFFGGVRSVCACITAGDIEDEAKKKGCFNLLRAYVTSVFCPLWGISASPSDAEILSALAKHCPSVNSSLGIVRICLDAPGLSIAKNHPPRTGYKILVRLATFLSIILTMILSLVDTENIVMVCLSGGVLFFFTTILVTVINIGESEALPQKIHNIMPNVLGKRKLEQILSWITEHENAPDIIINKDGDILFRDKKIAFPTEF